MTDAEKIQIIKQKMEDTFGNCKDTYVPTREEATKELANITFNELVDLMLELGDVFNVIADTLNDNV